jgi:hypothetical protein
MDWYYAVDHEQQGPVSDEVFAELVADGVIGPETLVWCESMADWRPYASIGGGVTSAIPPHTPPLEPGDYRNSEQKTEPLAIVSFVLAILSVCCGFLVLPAIVTGHIALSKIAKSNGDSSGRPLAIAGLVIGYLVVVFWILGIISEVFLSILD